MKYSSAEGRIPSWDGPWDDWGRERGEEVEDMDAERECRGWLLLLKSKPVLDRTAAIQKKEREKKRGRERVRARASSSWGELLFARGCGGPAKIGKERISSGEGEGGRRRRRVNTRMGEKGTA